MAGQNRREGDGIGGLSERVYAGEAQRAVRLNGNARALRDRLSVGNGELEIERGLAVFKRIGGGSAVRQRDRHFVFEAGEREGQLGQRAGVIADGEGLRRLDGGDRRRR